MELRHLRYFVAVAEALSFRKAARRLSVSAAALSQQIADLENELGLKLLSRNSSRSNPRGIAIPIASSTTGTTFYASSPRSNSRRRPPPISTLSDARPRKSASPLFDNRGHLFNTVKNARSRLENVRRIDLMDFSAPYSRDGVPTGPPRGPGQAYFA